MVLLCILDGYGSRAAAEDNAISLANTPVFDRLIETFPNTNIDGSGHSVGLPDGQMGNSEVGHLNIGAGRIIYQDISRIDRSIETGEFFDIEVFVSAFERAASKKKAIHLFGLLSDGKVHSSLDHLCALVELAKRKNVQQVYLHALLDGRDTPPDSGLGYMKQTIAKFEEIGLGKVATVGGRYYGMDRDKRWERVDKAFQASVNGVGGYCDDPVKAIEQSYADEVTDEFMLPVIIDNGDGLSGRVNDGDVCVMFNFRSDRARQFSYALCGLEYAGFIQEEHPDIELITMTNYDVNLTAAKVAFHPVRHSNLLGGVLSSAGKKQLRTAETEKYAHVTFFFNGGVEQPFEGEDRVMVQSPKVATYDLQPEMSSVEVTDKAVERIASGEYDFVLLNYANCDMVGHTGIIEATIKAVEAVDRGLGKLLAAIEAQNGLAIITADHGNAELMIDPATGGPWTAHTTNLVPCVLFDPSGKLGDNFSLREGGILADLAPTVLGILDMPVPPEMTGKSLIVRNKQ